MQKIVLLVMCAALSVGASAEGKQSSIVDFRKQTKQQAAACKNYVKFTSASIEMKIGGEELLAKIDPVACINNAKVDAKKLFPAALSIVAKKPSASRMLKDYYAAWIASMDNTIPGASESTRAYDQRLEATEARCDEIWNRFEIEAGL